MTLLSIGARRRSSSGFEPDDGYVYPLPNSGTLVSVPTYDGSGKSIHPSVVDMGPGQQWNGYRWWFADTPYAGEDDQLENPSIFASNDRANWVVSDGQSNPLVLPPAGGFHSDPDLVWDPDGQRLVIIWRDYVAARTPQMYFRTMWSTNGTTWHESDQYTVPTTARLSPVLWRAGPGDWRLWRFGGDSPPVMDTAPSPLGPWTVAAACDVGGMYNWHGDIMYHGGRWVGIFSNKSQCWPMASNDGVTWNVGASTLGFTCYRPTFTPSTEEGEFDIWSGIMAQNVYYHRRAESIWPDPPA